MNDISTKHTETRESLNPPAGYTEHQDNRTEPELRAASLRVKERFDLEMDAINSRHCTERVEAQKELATQQYIEKKAKGKTVELLAAQLVERTLSARAVSEKHRAEKEKLKTQHRENMTHLNRLAISARHRLIAGQETIMKQIRERDALKQADQMEAEFKERDRIRQIEAEERIARRD